MQQSPRRIVVTSAAMGVFIFALGWVVVRSWIGSNSLRPWMAPSFLAAALVSIAWGSWRAHKATHKRPGTSA